MLRESLVFIFKPFNAIKSLKDFDVTYFQIFRYLFFIGLFRGVKMNLNKVAEGLRGYVAYFDSNRSPVKRYLIASFAIKDVNKASEIKKYDIEFYEEIKKEKAWHIKHAWKVPRKDASILLFLPWILFIFWIVIVIFTNIKYLASRYGIIILMGLYVFYAYYYLRNVNIKIREKIAQKNDKRLREDAHKIIDYMRGFFKKERLNPKDFDIMLRHNDYKGLAYEKKGKHKYIAYVKID